MMATRNHDIPIQESTTSNLQSDNLTDISENYPDDIDSSANKNVSFTTDRLLSKLKRIESDNTEVASSPLHTIIKTIETNQRITLVNQDKIIGLLTQLTNKLITEPLDETTIPLNKLGAQLSLLISKLTKFETTTKEKHNAQA